MYSFVTIVILIASILMILVVLVQNSKGGGLAAGFSSSNQIMGVRKTTDFIEKATWTLAGIILVLCIVASAFLPSKSSQTTSGLVDKSLEQAAPVQEVAPTAPGFEAPVAPAVPAEEAPAE